MAKFQIAVLVIALFVLVADAQQRSRRPLARLSRQRTRTFARQEVAEADAAVTPYPSADELKPEVPFDEAEAAVEPTPDEVYGPPEASANNVPDEIYGPPEVSGNDLPAADAAPVEPAPVDEATAARLIQQRRSANYRRRQAAAAYRARAAAAVAARPAKLRSLNVRRTKA